MKKTIYTFLFIFLGLLSAKAQTILDEGFENTTDPFFVNVDTPELSSADSHSGSNCLYFAPAKGTWSQASDLFESNKWYHFPFWIKSSNPGELKLDHMPSDAYAVMGTDTVRATNTQDNGQSQIMIRDFVSFNAGKFILVTCDVYSGTASLYDGFGGAGNLVIGWWGEGSYFDDWKIEEEVQLVKAASIAVKGEADATEITTNAGTLQMLAEILPANADVQKVLWSVTNGTGEATISESGLLSAVSNGTVTVVATATDGSAIFGEAVITFSGQGSAVKEVKEASAQFNFYPNPVVDQMKVVSSIGIKTIEIVSISGQVILTRNLNSAEGTISVGALNTGAYLLRVTDNSNKTQVKLFMKN